MSSKCRVGVVTTCFGPGRRGIQLGLSFTVGNIGNQVWDTHDGVRVANGDVLYPLHYAGTDVAAVAGHTGCGAVTATLEAVQGARDGDHPPGVRERVEWLRPVVEDGLGDDRVDADEAALLADPVPFKALTKMRLQGKRHAYATSQVSNLLAGERESPSAASSAPAGRSSL